MGNVYKARDRETGEIVALKLLKQEWPKEQLEAAFAALNISPMERAEKLSLGQCVARTKLLS